MSFNTQEFSLNFSESWDAIVIGGGTHGLATAALLAKAGKRTLLLEKHNTTGGMHRAEELAPGYRTAGLIPIVDKIDQTLVKELNLGKHGLTFATTPHDIGIVSSSGQALRLSSDLEASASMLRKTMPLDAEGLLKIHGFLGRIGELFTKLTTGPQINLIDTRAANLWELLPRALDLRLLGKKDMFDVIRLLPMCLADFLSESLNNDLLKGGLAAQTLTGTCLGPWSPGSTTNFIFNRIAAGARIIGAGPALARSLLASAQHLGAEIRTSSEVAEILLNSGKAFGVRLKNGATLSAKQVFSSLDSHKTLMGMLPSRALSMKTQSRLHSFRLRGSSFIAHFALSAPPSFRATELNGLSHIVTADTVDAVERAFDPSKYRELPEDPVLDIHIPTLERAGQAPDGGHVVTVIASFVPADLKGGWNAANQSAFGKLIENKLESLAPGFGSKIVQRTALSPHDLKDQYGLTGGQLHHGEMSLDQIFMRPVPECCDGSTPVAGLYLCGMGMQPVGGMIGPPAIHAVQRSLRDA